MKAIRTSDGIIRLEDENGIILMSFHTESKKHMEELLKIVGKNVVDILQHTTGKRVDCSTLEIEE